MVSLVSQQQGTNVRGRLVRRRYVSFPLTLPHLLQAQISVSLKENMFSTFEIEMKQDEMESFFWLPKSNFVLQQRSTQHAKSL